MKSEKCQSTMPKGLYLLLNVAIIVLSTTVFLSIQGCDNQDVNQLKSENDSLKVHNDARDSIMISIVRTFAAVDSNMRLIAQKEDRIRSTIKAKNNAIETDSILYYINQIDTLTKSNETIVDELESKFGPQDLHIIGLRQLLESLKDKNQFKENELIDLKTRLTTINEDFRKLFNEFIDNEVENMELTEYRNKLEKQNKALRDTLNTAFYKTGTRDNLKSEGFIDARGILFESTDLNKNFDRSLFTPIDIRNFKTLKLNVRKAKMITEHPDGSYEFVGNRKNIQEIKILSPKDFWSVSKFLLIEVEEY